METLDLLLQASPRPDLRVVEECRTRVQHCLVGVEGDDGEDLEGVMWVRSHEQVRARIVIVRSVVETRRRGRSRAFLMGGACRA